MFLSTPVSDAAAQHGHEFSTPRSTTPGRLSPIPRTIRPASARQRPQLTTLPKSAVKPASAQNVAKVDKVMFAEEAEVKILSEPRRSVSESSEEDVPAVVETFTEVNTEIIQPDRKRKRTPRPRTAYNFAHPPPKGSHLNKLKVRRRPVLQLHQVASGSRPKPAFEILPCGRYACKLGRHLTQLHKGKDRLGTDDVVVVKAQEYDAAEDDELEADDVVGIICASCKNEGHATGNATLCLEDGSMWEAIQHPRGRYDFISTDEHGNSRVVRWVPRRVRARRQNSNTSQAPMGSPLSSDEMVYRFSTIDLRSRRHPVIANMTSNSLDINNVYYMPRPSVPSTPEPHQDITKSLDSTPVPDADDDLDASAESRDAMTTTNLLRSLILLSGVYVALRNNWAPHFSFKNGATANKPTSRTQSRANSPNGSPAPSIRTPSLSGIPPTTRRFTLGLHRRSTSMSASPVTTPTSGVLMSALNSGTWPADATYGTGPSRSTTPDSHRRQRSLFRSVTERWRQPSHSTISSTSTITDGSDGFSSGRSTVLNGTAPPTPTPGIRRAATVSAGFVPKKSGLRRHFRMPSQDTAAPNSPLSLDGALSDVPVHSLRMETTTDGEVGISPVETKHSHSRTFSFARGRSRHRKSLSATDSKTPTVFDPQWWVDWGRDSATSPATPVTAAPVIERPATSATTAAKPPLAQSPEPMQSPPPTEMEEPKEQQEKKRHRRRSSLSAALGSWHHKPNVERPKSVGVFESTLPGPRWGVPGWDGRQLRETSVEWGQGDVKAALKINEKLGHTGFGDIVRRVTHRLRREERRIA